VQIIENFPRFKAIGSELGQYATILGELAVLFFNPAIYQRSLGLLETGQGFRQSKMQLRERYEFPRSFS
jgi:hypothetical protein